jgi:uncharacterized repeat protein (TIGR03803 family)
MSKFYIVRSAFFAFALCAATAISSPAQTLTTLASFNGTDGNYGTVFKITLQGSLTTLFSFCNHLNP